MGTYEINGTITRHEAASILRNVAHGIESGVLEIDSHGEAVQVTFPDQFDIDVEYEEGDEDREFEIELEWETTDDRASSGGTVEDAHTARDADTPSDVDPDAFGSTTGSNPGAQFELFTDIAGEWRWRLVHRNGNVIATSGEGYTRKHNAEKGLQSVVKNAPDARIVRKTDG